SALINIKFFICYNFRLRLSCHSTHLPPIFRCRQVFPGIPGSLPSARFPVLHTQPSSSEQVFPNLFPAAAIPTAPFPPDSDESVRDISARSYPSESENIPLQSHAE